MSDDINDATWDPAGSTTAFTNAIAWDANPEPKPVYGRLFRAVGAALIRAGQWARRAGTVDTKPVLLKFSSEVPDHGFVVNHNGMFIAVDKEEEES